MDISIIKKMQKDKRNMLIFLKNNNTPIEVTPTEYTRIYWDSYNFYLTDDNYGEKNVVLLIARDQIAGVQFVKPKVREVEKLTSDRE